jgi:hypothetical protein
MRNHQPSNNEAIKSGASASSQSWDCVSRWTDVHYWMSLAPFDPSLTARAAPRRGL